MTDEVTPGYGIGAGSWALIIGGGIFGALSVQKEGLELFRDYKDFIPAASALGSCFVYYVKDKTLASLKLVADLGILATSVVPHCYYHQDQIFGSLETTNYFIKSLAGFAFLIPDYKILLSSIRKGVLGNARRRFSEGIGNLKRKKKNQGGGNNQGGAEENVKPNVWVSVDPKKEDGEYLKKPRDLDGNGVIDERDEVIRDEVNPLLKKAREKGRLEGKYAVLEQMFVAQTGKTQQGGLEDVLGAVKDLTQRVGDMEGLLQNYKPPEEKSS